jgi:tRNA pseudouridine55 synthase
MKLKALGYVSVLRRTKIGKFNVEDAFSLDYIEKIMHNRSVSEIEKLLLPIHSVLDDILVQEISESEVLKIKQGKALEKAIHADEGTVISVMFNGKLCAMCKVKNDMIAPIRVFNL